jgi:hypothetical protein
VLAFGEGPLTTDNVGKWTFAEAHVWEQKQDRAKKAKLTL